MQEGQMGEQRALWEARLQALKDEARFVIVCDNV